MNIFVTGGTGFVGAFLCQELIRQGHSVTVLTRKAQPPGAGGVAFVTGDPTREGDWMASVPDHDWVINLAGASIFARWTPEKKREIYDSRILTTRHLVQAMAAGDRVELFCSTSAPGYFGNRGEEELTEDSPAGDDFLGQVAKDWENEALKAEALGVRVVITRFGVVLGPGGGILGQLVPLFKYYVGGPVGSGRQWFSWIHRLDLARAYLFLPDRPEITGPVHFCAPQPVRNRELAKALGRVLNRPSFMPAPAFMLRLVMGELAEVALQSQKMLPQKLTHAVFQFSYPTIDRALENLLGQGGE